MERNSHARSSSTDAYFSVVMCKLEAGVLTNKCLVVFQSQVWLGRAVFKRAEATQATLDMLEFLPQHAVHQSSGRANIALNVIDERVCLR